MGERESERENSRKMGIQAKEKTIGYGNGNVKTERICPMAMLPTFAGIETK